jgi:hypothetical protein
MNLTCHGRHAPSLPPILAFAQRDEPANPTPKPTVEDAQKLVQTSLL